MPSFDPTASGGGSEEDGLRLYHAGYATRHDLDSQTYSQLNEYGEYSTRFSFRSGVGLPGRVYKTGQHAWERAIDEADPKFFERSGGARVYGIKTGLGLAMSTSVIGRMVIAMYSKCDLEEDPAIVQLCKVELKRLSPEPKWKLVIDMAPIPDDAVTEDKAWASSLDTGAGVTVLHCDYRSSAPPLPSFAAAGGTGGALQQSKSVTAQMEPQEEEQKIAVLLGDHIPLAQFPSAGGTASTQLIPLFMSLRLLLLRSPARRSDEENEIIEVIRKSYRGYAQDRRRTEKDIASLLVNDWQYLSANLLSDVSEKKLPAVQNQQAKVQQEQKDDSYKCHVMDAPSFGTFSSSGFPKRMPSLPDVSKIRSASLGSASMQNATFDPESPIISRNVNIVDEH